MKSLQTNLFIALALTVCAGQVHAIAITDRWAGDLFVITDVTEDASSSLIAIDESYGENDLTTTGDIVDFEPGVRLNYFDKIVDLQGATGNWHFVFNVDNDSPFGWPGYRFEFWDADFTTRLDVEANNILYDWFDSFYVFDELAGSILGFGAGAPLTTTPTFVEFNLFFNTDLLPETFGIRQVATTNYRNAPPFSGVPAPASFALFILGFASLSLVRRRRK